ncbi:Fanconi anemia core complex-associated protein 24 isoform X2 [Kryptolebias marmoratus]|uniref:Fanconi anemia core complex-associated protein 24 isoform X2 n=1 Tax=Kryptolebias marmoratus TaxID=37003 RepID=UPI0007F8C089|nr:Fanconi anemia core complex-associated protein 24 isoform X2 [Kryptolebias marmoratus]
MTERNKSAVVVNAAPPHGHVICSQRWRNAAVLQGLKDGGVIILFEDELGLADFHLPNRTAILYVSECDIIAGNGYKRKLACSRFQELVLVERTRLTEQYFSAVQKFVLFDLGLTLLPVGGQVEASQLIAQIVHKESSENPFRRRTPRRLLEPSVLALVQHIPGVGRVKALTLLQHFPSIQQVCNASVAELEPIVGQTSAQQVHSFFHKPLVEHKDHTRVGN